MKKSESQINKTGSIAARSSKFIAGGVVSLNRKVIPNIIFVRGKGSRIVDINGKEYIDYHSAFAPYLLGHNHDQVNHIQITNTGSEATAHAIRLARAFTEREHIVLTLGGYNGWHNEVARAVMPALEQIGPRRVKEEYPFLPMSAGIPKSTMEKVHIVNFNDPESLETILKKYPVAAVMTEPVLQNVGVIHPRPGYLKQMISLCNQYGAVSIFDEVKTGFRTSLGGYQGKYNLSPDLSVFGKAIANGYPLGVIGGRREIMELFDSPDPSKRVLIAGTYNAHPFNSAAAIATIKILHNPSVYEKLDTLTLRLIKGIDSLLDEKGIVHTTVNNGSAFCTYFSEMAPADLHDIIYHHNFELDIKYRKLLIENGVYHIPVPCKQGSVSYAHTEEDIDKTIEITSHILKYI
jgi:glutamate-1-semialdehyde 2,1-aminomutase